MVYFMSKRKRNYYDKIHVLPYLTTTKKHIASSQSPNVQHLSASNKIEVIVAIIALFCALNSSSSTHQLSAWCDDATQLSHLEVDMTYKGATLAVVCHTVNMTSVVYTAELVHCQTSRAGSGLNLVTYPACAFPQPNTCDGDCSSLDAEDNGKR